MSSPTSTSSGDLWTRKIAIPGRRPLSIREDFGGDSGLGGTIWDPTFHLIAILARKSAELLKGKRVVELGSGCGALGLSALRLGAGEVLMTERGDEMLDHLKDNVSENVTLEEKERVKVEELDWALATEDPRLVAALNPPFDLIVASECVYDAGIVGSFLETAKMLGFGVPLDSKRDPVILMCGVISEAAWTAFDKATDGSGEWSREEIEVPDLDDDGKLLGLKSITRPDRKVWRLRWVGKDST